MNLIWDKEELLERPDTATMKAQLARLSRQFDRWRGIHRFEPEKLRQIDRLLAIARQMYSQDLRGQSGIRTYMSLAEKLETFLETGILT